MSGDRTRGSDGSTAIRHFSDSDESPGSGPMSLALPKSNPAKMKENGGRPKEVEGQGGENTQQQQAISKTKLLAFPTNHRSGDYRLER